MYFDPPFGPHITWIWGTWKADGRCAIALSFMLLWQPPTLPIIYQPTGSHPLRQKKRYLKRRCREIQTLFFLLVSFGCRPNIPFWGSGISVRSTHGLGEINSHGGRQSERKLYAGCLIIVRSSLIYPSQPVKSCYFDFYSPGTLFFSTHILSIN